MARANGWYRRESMDDNCVLTGKYLYLQALKTKERVSKYYFFYFEIKKKYYRIIKDSKYLRTT